MTYKLWKQNNVRNHMLAMVDGKRNANRMAKELKAKYGTVILTDYKKRMVRVYA